MTITAADLTEALRQCYFRSDGVFATGVPLNGDSADLIWLAAASTHGDLTGHVIRECPDSNELATTATTWLQYCNRFNLVVPDTAALDDIVVPDKWGIMTIRPNPGTASPVTVVRSAPRLTPIPQQPALRALLEWQHWRLRSARTDADIARSAQRRLAEQVVDQQAETARLRAVAASTDTPITTGAELVAEIVTRLGGHYTRTGGDWPINISTDDVVQALRDLAYTRRQRQVVAGDMAQLMARVRQLRDALDRTLTQVPPLLPKDTDASPRQ